MADISEHDTKKEGEGNDGEDCWVHLLEHGDAIGVHNFLKGTGEIVTLDIGWLLYLMIFIPSDFSRIKISKIMSEIIFGSSGAPEVPNEY
jgi:hypothetical protein